MKSVIWDLYHGNICGKDIKVPVKDRKEEFAVYDKLKATLSEESNALFEEFLELSSESLPSNRLNKEMNYETTEFGSEKQRTTAYQSLSRRKRF